MVFYVYYKDQERLQRKTKNCKSYEVVKWGRGRRRASMHVVRMPCIHYRWKALENANLTVPKGA